MPLIGYQMMLGDTFSYKSHYTRPCQSGEQIVNKFEILNDQAIWFKL